jgi:uncharacterized protein
MRSETSFHGLKDEHISLILDTLKPYADKITQVGLFGSRATGTYRDHSDIDLVLYGTLDEADLDHLHTLFDESPLPMAVDVKLYHLIDYQPLKEHIDSVAKALKPP